MSKRVGDSAGRPVLKPFYADRLDALAALDEIPFKGRSSAPRARSPTPERQGRTDDERRDYLRQALVEYRFEARGQLLQMFPELNAEPDRPPIPPSIKLPPIPAGFEMAK